MKVYTKSLYLLFLEIRGNSFVSLTITPNELSIVCERIYEANLKPFLIADHSDNESQSWSAIRVSGEVKTERILILILFLIIAIYINDRIYSP